MLIKEELLKIIRSPRMFVTLIMLVMLGILTVTRFLEWEKTVGNVTAYNQYADRLNGPIDFSIVKKPASYTDGSNKVHFSGETLTEQEIIRELVQERYYYATERNKGWWRSEYEEFDHPHSYNGIKNYLDFLKENGQSSSYPYRYYEKKLSLLNQIGPPQYVNDSGTNTMLQILFGSQFSLIAICFSLMLLVTPIFSGESMNGMDLVILASRNGRAKDIRAKLLSVALITFLWITVLCFFILALYLLLYGNFAALNAPVHWISAFSGVTCHLTVLQYILCGYGAYLIGGLAVTMLYCLCSAGLKNIVLSFVFSLGVTVFPMFFDPNGPTGRIAAFFPSVSLSVRMLFEDFSAVNIGGYPILYSIAAPVVSLLIALLASLAAGHLYIRTQID